MTVLEMTPTTITPSTGGDDETPETSAPEYACATCGKEIFYAGRGRKPKFCDDHKSGRAGVPKSSGSTNAKLAASAADTLVSINALFAVGAMLGQYHATATAISTREDIFREQAYNALLTDPALCRTILRAGATSGKLSLVIAYGMLTMGVAPTAVNEFREKKAAAVAAREVIE